jgi:hypothetical protein
MYRTVLWSSGSLKWPHPQLTNSRDKYSARPLGPNLRHPVGHFINWTKLVHCKFGFDKYRIVNLRNYVRFFLCSPAVSYQRILNKIFLYICTQCHRKQVITSLTPCGPVKWVFLTHWRQRIEETKMLSSQHTFLSILCNLVIVEWPVILPGK